MNKTKQKKLAEHLKNLDLSKPEKITICARIDRELYLMAKKKKINISKTINETLKFVLLKEK